MHYRNAGTVTVFLNSKDLTPITVTDVSDYDLEDGSLTLLDDSQQTLAFFAQFAFSYFTYTPDTEDAEETETKVIPLSEIIRTHEITPETMH